MKKTWKKLLEKAAKIDRRLIEFQEKLTGGKKESRPHFYTEGFCAIRVTSKGKVLGEQLDLTTFSDELPDCAEKCDFYAQEAGTIRLVRLKVEEVCDFTQHLPENKKAKAKGRKA